MNIVIRSYLLSPSLNYHKNHTKACLELRNQKINKYNCVLCEREFMHECTLKRHMLSCITNTTEYTRLRTENQMYKQQIDEMKQKINDLETKLYNIAKRPTTTNTTKTTNIMNLIPFSLDQLEIPPITLDTMRNRGEGFAELLYKPLSKSMEITDLSRLMFKVKNDQGNVITDPKLTTYGPLIFEKLKIPCNDFIKEYKRINDVTSDNVDIYVELTDTSLNVDRFAENKPNTIQDDFIKKLGLKISSIKVCPNNN